MAISGTFLADFQSFNTAVDDAQVRLKSFSTGAGTVETSLNRMVNSFSGVNVVQQATLMAEAFQQLNDQGIGLTETELAKMGAVAEEAANKLRAMGQDVPPGIQAIADAADHVGQNFSDWLGGLDIQQVINDPIGAAKDGMLAFAETLGPTGIALAGVIVVASAGATALFDLATDAAAAGESVDAFGLVTGTVVDKVGAIGAGATIAGSSLDQFQTMLVQTQRRMDATGPSADKFNAALADLGISAEAFRAADPSDRIAILATGMQDAAGSTTLMSDALAIMGRAGAENIPALMRYTADVQQAGADLGVTWNTVTTKAAIELGEATATTGVELSTLATTIGVALIPATTVVVDGFNRTILALEHIADLGGLVSGGWRLLTGALGETALANQTFAATQDTANRLWAEATAQGLTAADAAYQIAQKMLDLGYKTEAVASATGLTTEAIASLKDALKVAQAAAESYTSAWDKITANASAYGLGIAGVSLATQNLIEKEKEEGTSIAELATAWQLAPQQIQLILDAYAARTKASNEQAKADQAYAEAMTNLNAVGVTWQQTLAGINPGLVEDVKQMLLAGASAKDIEVAWGLLPPVLKAVGDSIKDDADNVKLQTAAVLDVTKLWDDYAAVVASDSGSAYDKAGAAIDKWYNDTVAAHQKAKTDTAAFYAAVSALDDAKWAHLALNTLQADAATKQHADKAATDAQAAYQFALDHADSFTDAELARLKSVADATAYAAAQWTPFGDAAAAAAGQATAAVQGTIDALGVLAGTFKIPSNTGTPDTIESRLYAFNTAVAGGTFINPTNSLFAGLPSFDVGGPTRAGLAMLHDDEYVVPSGGALVSRGGSSGDTQPLTINLVVDGQVLASVVNARNGRTLSQGRLLPQR